MGGRGIAVILGNNLENENVKVLKESLVLLLGYGVASVFIYE